MRQLLTFALMLCLAPALPAQGVRHDVFASPAGDDANPGTKDRPVRTFHKALALVGNDGIVTLAGGVYREQADLFLQRGGAAEAPLIIQGAPGDPFGIRIRNNRVIDTVHQAIYIASSEGAIVENNTCWNNWADIVLHGTGFEEHGIAGDSPCQDPAKGDFRLRWGIEIAGKGWQEVNEK